MDKKNIEKLGIAKVEEVLIKTELIDPCISFDDKNISYDGDILLYSSNTFKKENLVHIIPVQVKSKFVKKFTPYISVDMIDLEIYKKKNCVLYFVVEFLNTNNYRIYCKSFLLWDLYSIINKSNGQKTKTVWFETLNISKPVEVLDKIQKFAQEAMRQTQINPSILSLESLNGKALSGTVEFNILLPDLATINDIYSAIKAQKPYVYYKNDMGTESVIDRLGLKEGFKVGFSYKRDIFVGGKKLYSGYDLEQDENGCICKIGKYITLKFEEASGITISFKLNGTLSERISTIEFMLGIRDKTVFFGDKVFSFGDIYNSSIDLNKLQKLMDYYKDIEKVFSSIGVYKDLNLDEITQEQNRELSAFVRSELYDETISLNYDKDRYAYLRLPNINILCYCHKNKDNKFLVKSIFEGNSFNCSIKIGDEYVPVSKYYYLVAEHDINGFEYVDNINYHDLYKDIEKHLIDEDNAKVSNIILLKLLLYYDNNQSELILKTCEKLAELLNRFTKGEDVFQLNLFQIRYRLRGLTQKEKEELLKIKDNTKDINIKWACSVLLNSKEEAEILFNKLTDEDTINLKSLPIYNIYLSL